MSELFRDFEELRDYSQDVLASGRDEWDNALARFVSVLQADRAAGRFVETTLPEVDYVGWRLAVQASVGVIQGSGSLTFPVEPPQRLALQLGLMRRIVDGSERSFDIAHDFFSDGPRYDDWYRKLGEKLVYPSQRDLTRLATPALEASLPAPAAEQDMEPAAFVAPSRLDELRALPTNAFDTRRLVRLCEELNGAWSAGHLMAVAALTRALLDHIPPLFGARNFAEVANNTPGRSFCTVMQRLDATARSIADTHLHQQVRSQETLPTRQQVTFGPEIDVLLAEIVRKWQVGERGAA